MKRPLVLVTTWLLAAGLAVGLGFLAVSFVNASPSAPSLQAAATTSDDRSGAAGTSAADPTSSGTAASARQVTSGGTVLATCSAGTPQLAGAPAAGWRIDDSASAGQVEFRNGAQKVEVRADCSTGSPVLTVDDSSGGGRGSDDSGTATTSPATTSRATPSVDDHGSGGQGADDPAGHVSGGHGADG